MDDTALIAEARGWIADCEWGDEFDPMELTAKQVRRGIECHYDGGWAGFIRDGGE